MDIGITTIGVTVSEKVAQSDGTVYVCDNDNNYRILFDFDAEWDAEPVKTARFKFGGKIHDEVFTGNEVDVPRISGVYRFEIGVFAGDLRTTTAAVVPCRASILAGGGTPDAPKPDVYAQIMGMLNDMFALYGPENVAKTIEAGLQEAKESGMFDGKDGITPAFTVGTVTTLSAGTNATAEITGTAAAPVLNLGIPRGADGNSGTGTGDMAASVYDPTGKKKDIFAYADEKAFDISKLTDPIPLTKGGTGAKSAADARANLGVETSAAIYSGVTTMLAPYLKAADYETDVVQRTGTLVPQSRTINGKNLQSNITLAASDVGAAAAKIGVVNVTASTSLALTHAEKTVRVNASDAVTITVRANANVAFPIGTCIVITSVGTGAVSIAPAYGVTINSKESKRTIDGQYAAVTLYKADTDVWELWGALA